MPYKIRPHALCLVAIGSLLLACGEGETTKQPSIAAAEPSAAGAVEPAGVPAAGITPMAAAPEANPPAVTPPIATPEANPPVATPEANPPVANPPVATPEANPPVATPPVATPEANPPVANPPVATPEANPPVAAPPVQPPPAATPPETNPPAATPPVEPPANLPAAGAGQISLGDAAPGWAGAAGVTGGGTDLASATTVSNKAEFEAAVNAGGLILMEPGDYDFGGARFTLNSNTTIIGKAPGVNLLLAFYIKGKENIIVRNVQIKGAKCGSFDACREGEDGVQIRESKNVWFDHVDVVDGQDGNFDVTVKSDNVTCSWCIFRYTSAKEHAFSNLIAGSDDEAKETGGADVLKVTYMYSWWGADVYERQPRGRFGKVHVFNCYYDSKRSNYVWGPGVDIEMLMENNQLDVGGAIINTKWANGGTAYKGVGNEGGGNESTGTVFDPPYEYDLWPASEVKSKVTSTDCGAGNTCTLAGL